LLIDSGLTQGIMCEEIMPCIDQVLFKEYKILYFRHWMIKNLRGTATVLVQKFQFRYS